jgi:hypothetical protein
MKVLKRGSAKSEEKPRQAECGKCKSTFEFVPREARYVVDVRDVDRYHVDCPVCQAIVIVAANV